MDPLLFGVLLGILLGVVFVLGIIAMFLGEIRAIFLRCLHALEVQAGIPPSKMEAPK